MFVPLFRYCYIAISVLEYRYKRQSGLKLWPKLLTENNHEKGEEIMDETKREMIEVLLIKGKFKIAEIAEKFSVTKEEVLEVARAKKSKDAKQKCAQ